MYILRVFDGKTSQETLFYSTKVSVVMEHIAFLLGELDLDGRIYTSGLEAQADETIPGFAKSEPFPTLAIWKDHDPVTNSASDVEDNQIRDVITVVAYNEDPNAKPEEKHVILKLMDISRANLIE